MTDSVQTWLIIGLVVVNCYTFGANCVERFVNYQTWPYIPSRFFRAYHRAQQPLILAFVVAPQAASFLLQLWLLFTSIPGVSRLIGWTLIGASVIGMLSTIFLQLPIHRKMNREGRSSQSMRALLRSDWIRKAADGAKSAATVLLLREVIKI
jgi:hypothetical protein